MDNIFITKTAKETQKIGENFAKKVLQTTNKEGAIIICLEGNLGGGKTTFTQGFSKGLRIKEKILSPTFVIQKRFNLKNKKYKNFYHIDCYRLNDKKDILELGFEEIIKNPENIILIEWAEKIKEFLPKGSLNIAFNFINEKEREIIFRVLKK